MTAVATTVTATPPVTIRVRNRLVDVLWVIFPFATVILIWQAVVSAALVPKLWLPGPIAVWNAFIEIVSSGTYLQDIEASLGRLLIGIVVSSVLGISLGVLMGLRRGFADFVEPLINFFNALSGIVWIPLAILWFGLGVVTVTFVIWNSMFFLILFNTLVGVKSVPRIYESAMMTMGGGRRAVIRDVLLPGALPNIVTGVRLGMAFGWRALIAAELFAASSGLGYLIYVAGYQFRSDIIIVGLITIGTIWSVIDRLVLVPFEHWTIQRWGLVTSQ
ncbi:MAG: ABC transporter permease [Chloroflexota bacterium]|nr:ABC transporter permease [Chloroflexota bacterium]